MAVTCPTSVWKHLPEAQGRAAGPCGSARGRVPHQQKAGGGMEHAAMQPWVKFYFCVVQECFTRQQEGGEVECGGHLQLAAAGPFCVEGGLHGQCP